MSARRARFGRRPQAACLALALASCAGPAPAPETPPPTPPDPSPPTARTTTPDAGAAPAAVADAPAPAPLPIPDGGAPPSLTLDERAAIVTSALDLALVEKAIPDYGLLKDPKNVVLSDANLAGLAPKVGGGVRLQVMSPDAIQSKADREGDFLFLELGPMAEDANGAIVVSLRNAWALSAASKKAGKIIMSGGGFALRFRRDGAGWKREVVMKWIS